MAGKRTPNSGETAPRQFQGRAVSTRGLRSGGGIPGDGEITRDTLDQVRRATERVARGDGILVAYGEFRSAEWDIDDVVAQFVANPYRRQRLTEVAAVANQALLSRWLEVSLRRLIIDQIRTPEHGKLDRWMTIRLNRRVAIVTLPPRRWALIQFQSNPPWARREVELSAASRRISVARAPWKDGSQRRGLVTNGVTLDALCTTILQSAHAPLDHAVLRHIVTARLFSGPRQTLPVTPSALETPMEFTGYLRWLIK